MPCWWPTVRACRTSRAWSRGSRAARAGSGRASQGAPSVGLLRLDRSRRTLSGEAHRRDAGRALSLQMHHHRAEHWIVVCGTALVTRGEEQFLLSENESTFIPLGVRIASKTRARCRSRSSKCSRALISARTTSSASTTSTAAATEKKARPISGEWTRRHAVAGRKCSCGMTVR